MPTFVLNDENVINTYGFRVRNSGIDFVRFDTNPVMLDSHINTTEAVMGKWKNRRVEGSQLLMDTEFDKDYDRATRLEGQVERGYVKGASPGLAISWDEEPFQRQPDGSWALIKCEMMEGSPCGVPSNKGALVQLYNKATGEPISEEQVKLSLTKLTIQKSTPNNPNMEKIILTPAAMAVLLAMSITTAEDVNQVSNAIISLGAAKAESDRKVTELQGKLDEQVKLQAKALADQAQLDGKITATEHAELMGDAILNFSLTSKLVAKMPGKVSLSDQVDNSTEAPAGVKTVDDFMKLSHNEQVAFKKDHKDAYQKLFA